MTEFGRAGLQGHPPELGLGRRQFLLRSTAFLAALATSPGNAQTDTAPFHALLDDFADILLAASPEFATALGLDTGARKDLRGRLTNRSQAAVPAGLARVGAMLGRLEGVDPRALTTRDRNLHASIRYALQLAVDGGRFSYGDNSFQAAMGQSATPYVVSHSAGTILTLPEFLDAQHPVSSNADADAYLARLSAMARNIRDETDSIERDAAAGVVPPIYILSNALTQIRAIRNVPAPDQRVVETLVRKARLANLPGAGWGRNAARIFDDEIGPALDRQITTLETLRKSSGDVPGVWRLPQGEDYYRWLLRVGTTTSLTAEEIHRTGLEQTQELTARIDEILQSQGLRKGTVGERLKALGEDPNSLFPSSDRGRAELVEYLNDRIQALRPIANAVSHLNLKAPVEVRRVPVDIQDGAALGYMTSSALDGSRPSIYYINLKNMTDWPRWTLPTLTAHETIPGHAWQGAYLAERSNDIPIISSLMGFNAFVEGWALYAEQLADEHGFYEHDPVGRIGYLQSLQFRACRLAVDTGLHAMRWSRQRAIDFLVEQTGQTRDSMTSEIDRYCVIPGQATGYKVGHNMILDLRKRASTAMGQAFDLGAFNDVLLRTGGVPLDVLAQTVSDYAHLPRQG